MLSVVEVLSFVDGATKVKFSDGSIATHQTVKDARGFMVAGPQDNMNAQQLIAFSRHNEVALKPNGGWL